MTPKLQFTKNYSVFTSSETNRPPSLESSAHKKLHESMKKYGFLPSYPIHVKEVGAKLEVKDGQHRLQFAKMLGLPVYYVALDCDVDVSEINQAQEGWKVDDYAARWFAAGIESYADVMNYCAKYRTPLAMSFAIHAETVVASNIMSDFRSGKYKITDYEKPYLVGEMYRRVPEEARSFHLFRALYSCVLVPEFDPAKMMESTERHPEVWKRCRSLKETLEMCEKVYNYSRKSQKLYLATRCDEVMRIRNTIGKKGPRK